MMLGLHSSHTGAKQEMGEKTGLPHIRSQCPGMAAKFTCLSGILLKIREFLL